ncbi:MAG: bifunctional hydroxymethylpyrimidine kinase/phosphomethylpyrimidine kinase [Bacteroidales bacterium]|jgi:hydroxymethylpyrimidine/phosphomethylpyrimidine kinase|nr:bifunctional hydroxymethylpyrimidine kinase/phosphomethylpyrimidine kinase [Bacteroidales bacterium]
MTSIHQYRRVLTVAGSDPSGGAGIQADLKTVSACGCYGMSAITAIVDEDTAGVYGVYPVPEAFVCGQIRSVLDDIGADAIKIGMLYSSSLIVAVWKCLAAYSPRNIVLDPVMVSTSGNKLLQMDAVQTLKEKLIPAARIITPNFPEAAVLLGSEIKETDFIRAAKELSCNRRVSVLLKAGHLRGDTLTDIFYNAEEDAIVELASRRINTCNTHGTGCTLSSAIAAFLAHRLPLTEAVRQGKNYVYQAIETGAAYKTGKGHGPVHHFFEWWK